MRGSLITSCGLVTALVVVILLLLFRGYFDRGHFEVTNTDYSSSKQIAVVAKRSDSEALNGDAYFVFISDHKPSVTELRRTYHSAAVIFSADESCLSVHWKSATELVVTCADSSIKSSHIGIQEHRRGGIVISYINVPNMSR